MEVVGCFMEVVVDTAVAGTADGDTIDTLIVFRRGFETGEGTSHQTIGSIISEAWAMRTPRLMCRRVAVETEATSRLSGAPEMKLSKNKDFFVIMVLTTPD